MEGETKPTTGNGKGKRGGKWKTDENGIDREGPTWERNQTRKGKRKTKNQVRKTEMDDGMGKRDQLWDTERGNTKKRKKELAGEENLRERDTQCHIVS